MNINTKVLVYSLSILSVSFIFWIFYLLNTNKSLQLENQSIHEKYEALSGFLQIMQHDLDASRDSVTVLKERLNELELKKNP